MSTQSPESVVAGVVASTAPAVTRNQSRTTVEVAAAIIAANGTMTNAELAESLGMTVLAFNGAKTKANSMFADLPKCKPAPKGRSAGDPAEKLRKLLADKGLAFNVQVKPQPAPAPAAETAESTESAETAEPDASVETVATPAAE